MAKYLIQDIIPPEKRARNASHHGATHKKHATHHIAEDGNEASEERGHELRKRPTTSQGDTGVASAGTGEYSKHDHDESAIEHHDEELPSNSVQVGVSQSPISIKSTPEQSISHFGQVETHENPMPPTDQDYSYKNDDDQSFDTMGDRMRISTSNLKRTYIFSIIGFIMIALTGYFVMGHFASATVTVIAKKTILPLEKDLVAYKEASEEELPFSVMKLTLKETKQVPATGEKVVASKASGKIVVYNDQTGTQRLIKNTRFESPSGKIYRINSSIDIPKSTTVNGKRVPGSLEVTVYADEPGPAFNSEPVDFTVPGLKGGNLYTKVYARSNGPISGGASGIMKTVSDEDLKTAGEDLRIKLESNLRGKARADILDSQIGYDGGIRIDLDEPKLLPSSDTDDGLALLEMEGTIYMVVFDKNALTNHIAKAVIPTWTGEGVVLSSIESLNFATEEENGAKIFEDDSLEFKLSGTAEFRWIVDMEQISKDLAGTNKTDFVSNMRKYTTVERAIISAKPGWKSAFPDDPTNIKVLVVETIND
jgi:hypothetical protein